VFEYCLYLLVDLLLGELLDWLALKFERVQLFSPLTLW